MISPLPRNKRAKNPHILDGEPDNLPGKTKPVKPSAPAAPEKEKVPVTGEPQANGLNAAFAKLEIK
jgi:hypothetical protein